MNATVIIETPSPAGDGGSVSDSYSGIELFALIVVFVAASIGVVSLVIWLLFRKQGADDEGEATYEVPPMAVVSTEEAPKPDREEDSGLSSSQESSLSAARKKFRESRLLLAQQQAANYGST